MQNTCMNSDGIAWLTRLRGGALQCQTPQMGAGMANGTATVLHRQAARGHALIGAAQSAGADQIDLR